ncbi:MAG TPA: signal peptidase I, partial [Clostridia bacterium]|nr:signal peptidase I [Clostridia bacterium]
IAFEREGALLIKRVIAMEGDQVSIGFEGKVSINGVEIEEGYLSSEGPGSGDVVYPVVVPAGRVFVMGDNRNVSVDSRNSSVGMLSVEEVIGCVKALVWPTERIRWI